MRVFIQCNNDGHYHNVNAYAAAVGFDALGFDIIKYTDANDITDTDPEAILVGGINSVRKRLKNLQLEIPQEIEYPKELTRFLNRKVWLSELGEIIRKEHFNIFIKPVQSKLFNGKLLKNFSDVIDLNYSCEVPVWCSQIAEFVTEWRCYVRYGELIDVRYYKGAWDSSIDLTIVKDAIESYASQPSAYCLDFAVDSKGTHYLVEVNDGHSLGSYGMGPITYAKLLSARWSQMTGTVDRLHF